MNRFSFLFVIICVLLFGCVEEEVTPIISVKTAESELNEFLSDPKGGVATLEFSINVPWSITIDYSNTSIGMVKDWLILSKTTGDAGDMTINLEVTENFVYDERSATINIKTASIVKRMKITQNQRLGMILSSDQVVLEYKEQVFTIDVNHNVDYNFEIQSDWITHIETKSLDKNTETFSIPENTTREKMFGCIFFMSKDKMLCDTVQVIQNPKSQRQFYIDLLCNGRWQGVERRVKGLGVPEDEWDIANGGVIEHNFIFTTNKDYNLLECYAFDSLYFWHGPFNYNVESRGDSTVMLFRTGVYFRTDSPNSEEWYTIKHLSEDSLVLYRLIHWAWASTGGNSGHGILPSYWKYEHQDRENKTEYIWENDTTSVLYKMLTVKEGWQTDTIYLSRYPYEIFRPIGLNDYPYLVFNLYFTKEYMIREYVESGSSTYSTRWYLQGNRIKAAGNDHKIVIRAISDSTLIIEERPYDRNVYNSGSGKKYYMSKK